MNIITVEKAIETGVGSRSISACAEWHKNQAMIAKGPDKERHFKIAADLRRVAHELMTRKK